MISNENILPYDRTLLTKVLPTGDASKMLMRPSEFIHSADIDYKLGTNVTKLDTDAKKLTLSNGEEIVSILYFYIFIEL